jgi:PucR C-terminal helix-turn-helix domain/GGDEF-like domain
MAQERHRARQPPLTAAAALAARDAGLTLDLLGNFAEVLAAGRRPSSQELAGYRGRGARAADEGAKLSAVIDLYLSAAWRLWPHLPAVTAAVGAADAGAVRTVAGDALRAADDAVAAVAEGWHDARRRAARREEAQRRELIDDLLGGTGDVAGVIDRAEAAGLQLAAPHRVFVIRGPYELDDTGAVARDLESILTARGPSANPLVASKDGLLACLVPDATVNVADLIATRLKAREPAERFRVAASRARTGVAGIRRGWQQGREALTLADRLALDTMLVQADDLLAYALLLHDPAKASELVIRTLGPLTTARGGAQPLVDTLLAVFEAGGNTTAAARALHLSTRGMHYRLKRITELTGYTLDKAPHRFALHAAALSARLLDWPRQPLPTSDSDEPRPS